MNVSSVFVLRPIRWMGLVLLLAGFVLASPLDTPALAAQEAGRVSGRLINTAKGSIDGATVVLLRFKKGQPPSEGPIGRVKANKQGLFVFENVPVDRSYLYQVGTRANGALVASDPFSFGAGKTTAEVELAVRIEGNAQAESGQKGVVLGRLIAEGQDVRVGGAQVVLLRFEMGPEGKPVGGPVANTIAQADGSFRFAEVPVDARAVYQVGARVGEAMVGSQPFAYPPGKKEVEVRIRVKPQSMAIDPSRPSRWLTRVVLVVEPHTGGASITEVLHFFNNTGHTLIGKEHPLVAPIQPGATNLEAMNGLDAQVMSRQGNQVLIVRDLMPGATMMALRYDVTSLFGRISLERSYTLPIDDVAVYGPMGGVEVSGEGFEVRPPETADGVVYATWGRQGVAPGQVFQASVGGLPAKPVVFAIPAMVFVLVMGGLLLWYTRFRLGRVA